MALVDSDRVFATTIGGALLRFPVRFETVGTVGELVERAASPSRALPAMIVLCVDSKRGAKKGLDELKKSILSPLPVLLSSAKATEKELHDELSQPLRWYLRKPFTAEVLMEKMEAHLAKRSVPPPDSLDNDEVEISVDAEEEGVVMEEAGDQHSSPFLMPDDATDIRVLGREVVGANAEAALNAIGPSAPLIASATLPTPATSALPSDDEFDQAFDSITEKRAAQAHARPAETSTAEESIAAKTESPSPTSFSRERDILTLREVINKKEKELLDLRDALDGKERQILDGKDRLRELERRSRDLDEKLLGFEREQVAAREKIQALTQDKEQVTLRERQVKGRLDEAQRAIVGYEAEIEGWKRRVSASESMLKAQSAEFERALEGAQQRERAAQNETDALVDNLKKLAGERDTLLQARTELQQTMASERAEFSREREELASAHKKALGDLRTDASRERVVQDALYEQQLADASENLTRTLAEKQQQHDELLASTLNATRREHTAEIGRLREEYAVSEARRAEEQTQALETQKAELELLHEQAVGDLQEIHQVRMRGERDAQQKKIAELESRSQAELAAQTEVAAAAAARIATDHTAELSERDQLISGANDQIEKMNVELQKLREVAMAHDQAQADLNSTRSELQNTMQELAKQQERVSDLEREGAGLQARLSAAHERMEADEEMAERAKKAIALALAVLQKTTGRNEP